MARALSGNVWITVMGNVNAIAVGTLTDVSCIVLTENASLEESLDPPEGRIGARWLKRIGWKKQECAGL